MRPSPRKLGRGSPLSVRRAMKGAQIFEIGGTGKAGSREGSENGCAGDAPEGGSLFKDKEGVKVTRPVQTSKIRVRDLDDSVESTDVVRAIASAGGCPPEAIKAGDVHSVARGTVWVRCSVAVANKLVAARKLRVGWINAQVEALERRHLQFSFRCLEKGHTMAQCGGGPDRSKCCYKCGEAGHVAKDCAAPTWCLVCADFGRKADHRAGSKVCVSLKRRKKKAAKKLNPPPKIPSKERKKADGKSPLPLASGSKQEEVFLPQRQERVKRAEAPKENLPSTT